jgi:hypothetical protein
LLIISISAKKIEKNINTKYKTVAKTHSHFTAFFFMMHENIVKIRDDDVAAIIMIADKAKIPLLPSNLSEISTAPFSIAASKSEIDEAHAHARNEIRMQSFFLIGKSSIVSQSVPQPLRTDRCFCMAKFGIIALAKNKYCDMKIRLNTKTNDELAASPQNENLIIAANINAENSKKIIFKAVTIFPPEMKYRAFLIFLRVVIFFMLTPPA